MRLYYLAGITLIAAGIFVLARGGTFTSQRDVLKVGDVTISAEQQHPIRPWFAGLAVIAGAGLLVTGIRRKT